MAGLCPARLPSSAGPLRFAPHRPPPGPGPPSAHPLLGGEGPVSHLHPTGPRIPEPGPGLSPEAVVSTKGVRDWEHSGWHMRPLPCQAVRWLGVF